MADNFKIHDASFVVVDFETVTPKGRPPEPLELAALMVGPELLIQTQCFETLIKPPSDAPITAFDTAQTGIRPVDVRAAPLVLDAIAKFSTWCGEKEIIFVAQNARYEAGIFARFLEICPFPKAQSFLDTVQLAKAVLPGLSSYRLDSVAAGLGEVIPPNRHRAMPDVQLTARVFRNLVLKGISRLNWNTVTDLFTVAGIKKMTNSSSASAADNQLSFF